MSQSVLLASCSSYKLKKSSPAKFGALDLTRLGLVYILYILMEAKFNNVPKQNLIISKTVLYIVHIIFLYIEVFFYNRLLPAF